MSQKAIKKTVLFFEYFFQVWNIHDFSQQHFSSQKKFLMRIKSFPAAI